jgi:hypothetical protein
MRPSGRVDRRDPSQPETRDERRGAVAKLRPISRDDAEGEGRRRGRGTLTDAA